MLTQETTRTRGIVYTVEAGVGKQSAPVLPETQIKGRGTKHPIGQPSIKGRKRLLRMCKVLQGRQGCFQLNGVISRQAFAPCFHPSSLSTKHNSKAGDLSVILKSEPLRVWQMPDLLICFAITTEA